MSLANPFYSLFLIIPLILGFFYIWSYRKTTRDLEAFAEKGLLPKIIDYSGQRNRRIQWIFRLTGLIFLVFALTGPEWGYQWQEIKRQGVEIIFAMDTSNSMLAVDIKPNRLERAKLAVKDLLAKLQGDKVGLVAFSGTSFLQCPLTLDYNAFTIALDALSVLSIPRGGTAIGEAIKTAVTAFKSGGSGSKILILITDGENHEGDPSGQAQEAAKQGIAIFTIGVGSPEGELIVMRDQNGNSSYLKDAEGNVVKSALNETVLRKIAQIGNGAYYRGNSVSMGLDDLYLRKIVKLDKSEVSSKWHKRYINRFQIPLLIATILLLMEIGYGRRVLNRILSFRLPLAR